MKILIIDDEPNARILLSAILKEYAATAITIFEADNLLAGVSIIREKLPDVVFLDIEMPQHSGLEIINHLDKDEFGFDIIVTTAYDDYAIEAFEVSAIDYLLKPMQPQRVMAALKKVYKKNDNGPQTYQRLTGLNNTLQNPFGKIKIPVNEGFLLLKTDTIMYLEADSMYTKFFLNGYTEDRLISKPLKYFETLLKESTDFFRPHRKYLINLNFVKQYNKKDGGIILMENNVEIPISNKKKSEFLTIFDQL